MKWWEAAVVVPVAVLVVALAWLAAEATRDMGRGGAVVTHELWDGRLICIQRAPQEDGQ